MKLIVGLGNPDRQYLNTFHNLGFMSADKTAALLGVEFKKEKFRALLAEKGSGENKIILAKPLTYMNLSGESIREIASFYKIDSKDILVIYDDYDLKKGFIRIRESGSAGTHNGMRNVIKELIVLDTINMQELVKACPKIKVMPVARYIAKAITTIYSDSSLSAIYED